MLFNSYIFLLAFAPLTYVTFFLLGRRHVLLASAWLSLASIVFYGWWNPWNVPILLASVAFNYAAGEAITRAKSWGDGRQSLVLGLAVSINLCALAYYKYANFLVDNLGALTGLHFALTAIVLPLGISFFTFTQIAYLVDTYKGKVTERNPVLYLLFVSYFPHLIAGPIIHHKDVMPQFAQRDTYAFSRSNFTVGTVVFVLGMFKKCFIADNVSAYATPIFEAAERGVQFGFLESWGAALAYTFQLYFDFSGYSDMAIGLSLMLNVRLPLNFNSPYKATSIVDFWKRWHISLSTFLRDYLYIPLGGNRLGDGRRFVNLFLTMLIGGLWHGAGWTFVIWGGLHGLYLVINHGWRGFRSRIAPAPPGTVERCVCWGITFVAVVVAWVFFRASTFGGAGAILSGMAGLNGTGLPEGLMAYFSGAGATEISTKHVETGRLIFTWCWCVLLLISVVFLPNTQELVESHFADRGFFEVRPHTRGVERWRSPDMRWVIVVGLALALALMNISQPSEFLYFNF